ncbi:MAG: thiolase domain-containing protein [Candidatus Bathyarchaeota archaeon]|nr:thiolase domain-containing protein [Candidatus Bathyarchaeota archaeon]MDH5778969.1 thiolase domain-containing protein [Candidatus Bathyarchaeota archaeon]
MKKVAIVGVGQTKFDRRSDASIREISFEAFKEALDDAELTPKEIDASVIGSATHYDKQRSPAGVIAEYLGLNPRPTFTVEAICASGGVGLRTAWALIGSGLHDTVAVVGFQKMTELKSNEIQEVMGRSGDVMWECPFGTTMPAYFAMYANAHMDKYGTTEEQLAKVAVKNHSYAAKNPKAMFQKPITLDDVLTSRIIASPLKRYDCCANSDGAACLILASEEKAKKITDTPVWVAGLGLGSASMTLMHRELPLTSFSCAVEAAKQAYKMAAVKPEDIDVAEVHDCFTITEIVNYEDLGFCGRGEGGKLVEEEQTYVGGKIPVNIDGGLLAKGHPVGATGASQIRTLVQQLRGEAGETQVPGAEIGLAHNLGGIGMYCAVTILKV